jgi:hypothetical protein
MRPRGEARSVRLSSIDRQTRVFSSFRADGGESRCASS